MQIHPQDEYLKHRQQIEEEITRKFMIMGTSHALICRVIDTKKNETVSSMAMVSDIAYDQPDNPALINALRTLLCEFRGFSQPLQENAREEALRAIVSCEAIYSINRRDGFLQITLKERQ